MRKHDPERSTRRDYFYGLVNELFLAKNNGVKDARPGGAGEPGWFRKLIDKLFSGGSGFEPDQTRVMKSEERESMDAYIREIMKEKFGISQPVFTPSEDSKKFHDVAQDITDAMVSTSNAFMDAAEHGRTEEVMELVKKGFPLNYQDPVSGKSALHLAAASCARPLILAMINSRVPSSRRLLSPSSLSVSVLEPLLDEAIELV